MFSFQLARALSITVISIGCGIGSIFLLDTLPHFPTPILFKGPGVIVVAVIVGLAVGLSLLHLTKSAST